VHALVPLAPRVARCLLSGQLLRHAATPSFAPPASPASMHRAPALRAVPAAICWSPLPHCDCPPRRTANEPARGAVAVAVQTERFGAVFARPTTVGAGEREALL
jgi:hypothetical protein